MLFQLLLLLLAVAMTWKSSFKCSWGRRKEKDRESESKRVAQRALGVRSKRHHGFYMTCIFPVSFPNLISNLRKRLASCREGSVKPYDT